MPQPNEMTFGYHNDTEWTKNNYCVQSSLDSKPYPNIAMKIPPRLKAQIICFAVFLLSPWQQTGHHAVINKHPASRNIGWPVL